MLRVCEVAQDRLQRNFFFTAFDTRRCSWFRDVHLDTDGADTDVQKNILIGTEWKSGGMEHGVRPISGLSAVGLPHRHFHILLGDEVQTSTPVDTPAEAA